MKFKLTALAMGLVLSNVVSAATPIDLRNQPVSYLQKNYNHRLDAASANQANLKTVRTSIDRVQTTHVRLQQTFAGYQVWDATAVVHTPNSNLNSAKNIFLANNASNTSTMNGVVYEGLEKDLANTPSSALTDAQKAAALKQAKGIYAQKTRSIVLNAKKETTQTIVFVDENKQAHYAYLVSFYLDDGKTGAHRPMMILDAATLKLYRMWDRVKTIEKPANLASMKSLKLLRVDGVAENEVGGFGGNEKTGSLAYDSDAGNLPALKMATITQAMEILPGQLIDVTFCAFSTLDENIAVVDVSYDNNLVIDLCYRLPGQHNNAFWISVDNNGTRWKNDQMNGGYSPTLDAYYGANIIKGLYNDWFNTPALVQEDGQTPYPLIMRTHYGRNFDNAFWDGEVMTFGDGGKMFYPLTSLDVAAHEVSHGFTDQRSQIDGSYPAMGALHEAFSDMAAAAAQYYVNNGKPGWTMSWAMGRSIMKGEGALRYIDNPTKDGTSIDNMNDFNENTEPHAGAGVFNKAFYLLATTAGWDVKKAFEVMANANMHYWTSSMRTFNDAACGVVAAAHNLKYNEADVRIAFAQVGVKTDICPVLPLHSEETPAPTSDDPSAR